MFIKIKINIEGDFEQTQLGRIDLSGKHFLQKKSFL